MVNHAYLTRSDKAKRELDVKLRPFPDTSRGALARDVTRQREKAPGAHPPEVATAWGRGVTLLIRRSFNRDRLAQHRRRGAADHVDERGKERRDLSAF